ncbi:MAG: YgiQ family radical SAM protein [Bacteroidota bacterium]
MTDRQLYYPDSYSLSDWLPISRKEVVDRGWDELDVVLFSGDAYIDHPSFGAPVIGRILERAGYKVAIIPQPNWRDDLRDFTKLGKPRLFFGVTAGNMDSMVNHYTANRRLRSNDAYTVGNRSGFRPDRALTVYSGIIRKLFPDSLIIAGGIEASLRRLTHYDYWDDQVHPSILVDRTIDYVVYGNGERPILELARLISSGASFDELRNVPQIGYVSEGLALPEPWPGRETKTLFSYEEIKNDKLKYARNFRTFEEESNILDAARIVQQHNDHLVVINPPFRPATTEEMDDWHSLPFTRLPHPRYWNKPLIPAFEMIRFSVNIHRGCFGGCSFCTISAHQGKHVSSRSEHSIMTEIKMVVKMPGFKGYLSDIGGPSANMYRMEPLDPSKCRKCKKPSCINPSICKNLDISHKKLLTLMRKIRQVPGIKKAFVGSGIRYDLFLNERATEDASLREYPAELISHHVSGRLKVAPEHTREQVLRLMRKPGFEKFHELKKTFDSVNRKNNLRQELIPYFISSHPGCTLEDMAELSIETRALDLKTDQVQDFTPTPMTLATTMFYTGLNPYTLEPVYVAKTAEDKLEQKSLFFWSDPAERQKIIGKLKKLGRNDLIDRLYQSHKLKHVKGRTGHHQNK